MQRSTVILVPGLGDSGEQHWQTLWQKHFPGFERIQQKNWDAPAMEDWVENLDKTIREHQLEQVVLVAHSLGCLAAVFWAQKYKLRLKGALLVAPADTESPSLTDAVQGFAPIPMEPLPFRSVVVSSMNDPYLSTKRAQQLAEAWGSRYVNIGMAGHINATSGYGRWDEGLELLKGLTGQ